MMGALAGLTWNNNPMERCVMKIEIGGRGSGNTTRAMIAGNDMKKPTYAELLRALRDVYTNTGLACEDYEEDHPAVLARERARKLIDRAESDAEGEAKVSYTLCCEAFNESTIGDPEDPSSDKAIYAYQGKWRTFADCYSITFCPFCGKKLDNPPIRESDAGVSTLMELVGYGVFLYNGRLLEVVHTEGDRAYTLLSAAEKSGPCTPKK